jgi:hypothetical protein
MEGVLQLRHYFWGGGRALMEMRSLDNGGARKLENLLRLQSETWLVVLCISSENTKGGRCKYPIEPWKAFVFKCLHKQLRLKPNMESRGTLKMKWTKKLTKQSKSHKQNISMSVTHFD